MWHALRSYDCTSWTVTPSIRIWSGFVDVSLRMELFDPPAAPPHELAGPYSPPTRLTFVAEKISKLRPLRDSRRTFVTSGGLRGRSSGRTVTSTMPIRRMVT
jgi:hypothetical protein